MRFFVQKIPVLKGFLTRMILFVNRFSKFLLHIFRQTKCQIVARKDFILALTVAKYLQKPLSETRKHAVEMDFTIMVKK